MGIYWKPLGGLAGLMGYPLQGIYKSVYSAIHTRTRKRIAEARRAEGVWALQNAKITGGVDVQGVLRLFDALCKTKVSKEERE
jgi:hypothetical protein